MTDDDHKPPFPGQPQPQPGFAERMEPRPDRGAKAAEALGRIDILVNNAASRDTFAAIEDIDDAEWDCTFRTSTKGAIQNFTAGLAKMLATRGIRANCVAPGPIWTPLIPATMPSETVREFGKQVPMERPGRPAELAPVYVLLASDEASYVSGATMAVTGGKAIL